MRRSRLFLVSAALLPLLNCGGSQHSVEEKYYLVSTNIKLPYWQQAFAGLSLAGSQLQIKTEQVGPDTYDPKGQHEEFLNVLKQKPSGILVSPSDPNVLNADIDAAIAQGIPVITIDSDAPTSKRLTFIGTDNYKAGIMGGRLLAKQLGEKGTVVVYTMPEQVNLKERLKGYQDVFEEHPQMKISEVIDSKGDPRVVFDRTMEMIEKQAKVDGFVCLASFEGPEVSEVLARKNVTGKVVMAMDTDQRTLEGIQKGFITATIGQKPFTMAYLAVKMLDDLHHHPLPSMTLNFAQDSFSPLPVYVNTGATMIDKSNVETFIRQRNSATSGKQ